MPLGGELGLRPAHRHLPPHFRNVLEVDLRHTYLRTFLLGALGNHGSPRVDDHGMTI